MEIEEEEFEMDQEEQSSVEGLKTRERAYTVSTVMSSLKTPKME